VRGLVATLAASQDWTVDLKVHVHPEDLAALHQAGLASSTWRWIGDPSVAMGGVVLRSDAGSLDARLGTQLEALRQRLVAARERRRTVA
jgi:flagellar biosynthesis/type III secretory pathway protein FliH